MSRFCSPKCRYKKRDRERYAADPDTHRARARAYYWANREAVLEKSAARRGCVRPPERSTCSECEGPLEGLQRVVCSPRCRGRRYARRHPEELAEKQRRKRARRRAREGRRKARRLSTAARVRVAAPAAPSR
jgi:hypothetical protein